MKFRLAPMIACVTLLTTACSKSENGTRPPTEPIEHPTGADELVVRIASGGGLIPEDLRVSQIPGWSLYGDGTLITVGPQIEIYPQPALPNLLQQRVSEDGVQAVLRAADAVGLLDRDAHLSATDATDLWTTTMIVSAGGAQHTTSVYGLGFQPAEGAPPSSGQDAARISEISGFASKVGDPSWAPLGSMGTQEAYPFQRMRVFAFPYEPPSDPSLHQKEIPWPLERNPEGCLVLSGPEFQEVLPLAREANQLTPWVSSGERSRLIFRPLLPDEGGC